MGKVSFEDNRMRCKAALADAGVAFLHEAAVELVSQTARNSRVRNSQLKGSWDYVVDEAELTATIGSPLENAIWEEFGTGEYALNGNGRKDSWRYKDEHGQWHTTIGKKPNRALWKAMETLKPSLQAALEEHLKGLN